MAEKKKSKWIKFRHRVVRNVAYVLLTPYIKLRYGIKIEKFKEQNGRQYLILLNHQTSFDQFFVGIAFKGPIYYLATEDIFSMGFVSKLISFLIAPIPIKKQATDIKAVLTCMRVAREGGTIAMCPEGNRTYCGRTVYINPAVVPLIKKLGLPVAFFRIEDGYGVQPRWSDNVRKGKMKCYFSKVIEPEEYADMDNDSLYKIICSELDVNEACVTGEFKGNKRAEYLERCIYVCPHCGFSEFKSKGNIIHCVSCGRETEYTVTKELKGIGHEHPFRFVAQWYDYQQNFVNSTDMTALTEKPVYKEKVGFYEVILYKNKVLLNAEASVSLYGDRIEIGEDVYRFSDISFLTVLGKNKMNMYYGGKVYQFKGAKGFNPVKYMNFYYRYKNIVSGGSDAEFLGL